MILDQHVGIPVGVKWFFTGVMINLRSEELLMLLYLFGFDHFVFQSI